MELQNIAVLGISGATLVTIIVAIASSRGLASDWKPAASALAGMFVVGLYEVTQVWPAWTPLVEVVVGGLLLGAGGSGIYSHMRAGQKARVKANTSVTEAVSTTVVSEEKKVGKG
jgi:uncharacterized membrane-anchored protein YitT (DUF2179 family)